MIRQQGVHRGKTISFGFDRYLLPELDEYTSVLARFGHPAAAVQMDRLHYLSSAERVCERVQGQPERVGVLICGTGMGMSIAANKFRGIYAARCLSIEDAESARIINNANVLCLAARSGRELNAQIIEAFMTTPFTGRKVDELAYIETLELESAAPPALARVGRMA
jgi:ribose 5-phosphate isomerase B